MIVTDCDWLCFNVFHDIFHDIFHDHFLMTISWCAEISVISEDLRERSAEVWAQCRALATELGEAEAALARRQAEECLGGELPPWTLENSGFWRIRKGTWVEICLNMFK